MRDHQERMGKAYQPKGRSEKLENLHTHLLGLNIIREVAAEKSQHLVSETLETDQLISTIQLKRKSEIVQSVPLRFSSTEHYSKLWEHLFFDEAKTQILHNRQENRSRIDRVEVEGSSETQKRGQSIMHLKQIKSGNQYLPGTLVILSPTEPKERHDFPHLTGIVEPGADFAVRVELSQSKMEEKYPGSWNTISEAKRWYIQEIGAIHTLEREYLALSMIDESLSPQIKEIILHPGSQNNKDKRFKIPLNLETALRQGFNDSQFKAVSECLKQSGVTLIQGPPGTGKTKTVLGTLSVLLSSFTKQDADEQEPLLLSWKKSSKINKCENKDLNPWLYDGYEDWRDQPLIESEEDPLNLTDFYDKCEKTDQYIYLTRKQEGITIPGKVLICGPSNASVDQIIRKMLSDELLDREGKKYIPNFVRIGENYDPSLKEYSLDSIAERMGSKDSGVDISTYKNKILTEYRLIFSTLSAAGSQIIENSNVTFDTVVIDEAGQSTEISNLIPLMHGCQRLILIGDPNQLPATVFSQRSLEHNYDQSLFERLMKAGYPVTVLRTQYRMHPEISAVIGENFYAQKLLNADNLKFMSPQLLPHSFLIIHIDDSAESSYHKSFRNKTEAKAIVDFVNVISKNCDDIGVISPYSQQVAMIQSMGLAQNKKCEVRTIDSFQGRQKEVVIFSAVRSRWAYQNKKTEANRRKTIGFVGDFRRINVSLSRAKSLCVVFADAKRLRINPIWRNIIDLAVSRSQVYSYSNAKNFYTQLRSRPDKFLLKTLQ